MNYEKQKDSLFAAEIQFRLSCAVRIACTMKRQPLDMPQVWSHGSHSVNYEEIALSEDQADISASLIQKTSTYLIAVVVKDSIEGLVPKLPKIVHSSPNKIFDIKNEIINTQDKIWTCSDDNVSNAYLISRLIRNAFAHAPFNPKWMIGRWCDNCNFVIPNVISLETNELNDKVFEWKHYGGLLSVLKLCRFVRSEIFQVNINRTQNIPKPKHIIYQQGNLFFEKIG